MAATNFTPIQLFHSTTASAAPSAGNLANGELAINITDGKLYYKDNGGVVQVLATKGTGSIGGTTTQIQYNNAGALAGNAAMTFNSGTNTTTLTTLNLTNALGATHGGTAQSAYAQGDFLYASATNTLAKLGIGTANFILTSTGSVPQWVAPTSITVQTANNLAGGLAGSVPYQSAVDTTTFLAIGAANRVMTSTGSAPQWVTSLTGLTGVSSSSITNTSLTSGRVVVSSTGGLQSDSSNLTFNGTTLSAGGLSTTGLSTLVRTVTVGDSNFSGVAVFAPATPAKLYIGTGTVTDTTSAIGATNATGAVASLAITPIAATNTSVTYTNAATLYIAGAPSASTNVTITNPYALYVAAGDAFFGGTVTAGTVNLTTLDLTNLEVTNIKAKDGTAAITLADSTGVATFAANPIINAGTANGVAFLNASKVLTTGSALTFDGTNLAINTGSVNIGGGRGSTRALLFPDWLVYNSSTGNGLVFDNGSEQMRLTSTGLEVKQSQLIGYSSFAGIGTNGLAVAGNVGIGTSSPGARLVVSGSGNIVRFGDGTNTFDIRFAGPNNWAQKLDTATDVFSIQRNSVDFVAVTSAGNVGIGTSSPTERLHVAGALRVTGAQTTAGTGVYLDQTSGTGGVSVYGPDNSTQGTFRIYTATANGGTGSTKLTLSSDGTFRVKGAGTAGSTDAFQVAGGAPADAARIDSSGNLLVGTTSLISGTERFSLSSSASDWTQYTRNTNASPYGLRITYSNAAPNGTGNEFLYCSDNGPTLRASIRSNGGLANYSANNVNLSDRREKTNFAPAKSYLDVICAIPVQTFNYIDQNMEEDGGLTLGVVAQDVQAVAPELVMESNWGSKEEPKQRLSIYQTDLQYALMKCIQEQQALITALTARITALESN